MGVKVKKTVGLKNQKGMATLESVVLLVLFLVITSYTIGFFGIIHTGIKNSIGARSLAFETFRNRANVSYWRDNINPRLDARGTNHYKKHGYRTHGIISETSTEVTGGESPYYATARQVAYVRNPDFRRDNVTGDKISGHETQEANAVYIKVKYGICLNATCEKE
jgi:hypothetical protein